MMTKHKSLLLKRVLQFYIAVLFFNFSFFLVYHTDTSIFGAGLWFDVILLIALVLVYFLNLLKPHRYPMVSYLFVLTNFVLLLVFIFFDSVSDSLISADTISLYFPIIFILLAFYFRGLKRGLIWVMATFAVFYLNYLLSLFGLVEFGLSLNQTVSFLLTYGLITLIVYSFETDSNLQQQKITEQNKKLARINLELKVKLKKLEEMKHDAEGNLIKINQEKSLSEAVISAVGEGLAVLDRKGRVLMVNKAFTTMLGWSEEEVKEKKFTEVVELLNEHQEIVPENVRLDPLLAYPGKNTEYNSKIYYASFVLPHRFYYVRKNKTKLPVQIITAPVVVEGEVIGFVKTFFDISHELELDDAKREFISMAAHQLRTPVNSIKWGIESLTEDEYTMTGDEKEGIIEQINDSSDRLLRIINTFLNVSKVDQGSFRVKPVELGIGEVLSSNIKDKQSEIAAKQLQLEMELSPDIPSVKMDPDLLAIIFDNLLSNSIKYTPQGGKISVNFYRQNFNVVLAVSDSGYGIPDEEKRNIFKKMYRAQNVQEKKINGTGLGLYMVKEVVEQSGGKIWFDSHQGQGTTFFVSYPLVGMKDAKEGAKLHKDTE